MPREIPKGGWRCFFCDDVFTSVKDASEHFGPYESCTPACIIGAGRGLVREVRRLEVENANLLSQICDEYTSAHNMVCSQAARHAGQLQKAEELGYERGLRDAQFLKEEGR